MNGRIKNKAGKTLLIIGKAHQMFLAPSKKDSKDKHLYSFGSQLYSYWPYQSQRCITTYHGLYVGDCEIIVYGDDCIHPHIERTWPEDVRRRIGNSRARFEATIKEERAGNQKNPKKTAGILSYKTLKLHWPMILVGAVVLVAFLVGGGKI